MLFDPPPYESPMSPEDFADKMREIFPPDGYDKEGSHAEADQLMRELLRVLGYGNGVDIFEAADKWCA